MGSEYVGISSLDMNRSKTVVLQVHLEILNLLRSFSAYKDLRSEELTVKVALKSKIGEAFDLLHKLDKQLPHPKYKTPLFSQESKRTIERNLSLEEEIEDITRKLHALQTEI